MSKIEIPYPDLRNLPLIAQTALQDEIDGCRFKALSALETASGSDLIVEVAYVSNGEYAKYWNVMLAMRNDKRKRLISAAISSVLGLLVGGYGVWLQQSHPLFGWVPTLVGLVTAILGIFGVMSWFEWGTAEQISARSGDLLHLFKRTAGTIWAVGTDNLYVFDGDAQVVPYDSIGNVEFEGDTVRVVDKSGTAIHSISFPARITPSSLAAAIQTRIDAVAKAVPVAQ